MNNFAQVELDYGYFIIPVNYTPGPPTPSPLDASKHKRTHIEEELSFLTRIVFWLDDNSVIIDGGANIGYVSIPIATQYKNKNLEIHAFEPQKMLFYALGGTVALNDLNNVTLHNKCLGAVSGKANIPEIDFSQKSDFGMVAVSKDKEENVREVDVVAIDDMNLRRLDFLKLDIEGYECEALRGGIETIKKYRPWIWIEYNLIGIDNIKKELADISDYDYIVIDWQNMLLAPKERLDKVK
jgi:FkbM family methyltransferase